MLLVISVLNIRPIILYVSLQQEGKCWHVQQMDRRTVQNNEFG